MPSKSLLALVSLATAVYAAPPFAGTRLGPLQSRDIDQYCANGTNGWIYVAEIGYYDDHDCTNEIGFKCLYGLENYQDEGLFTCLANQLPANTPFYAKMHTSPFPDVQIDFTTDQVCLPPGGGVGSAFATLMNNQNCVKMNKGGDSTGIKLFPNGGSNLQRVTPPTEKKRSGLKCKAFNYDKSKAQQTSSEMVKCSDIVSCINGATAGCTIEEGEQHTTSITTSYSLEAGGDIEGLFSLSATFGQEFTDSTTTTYQHDHTIEQGQAGYLVSSSSATLFPGTYTKCSDKQDHPGEVLAIKKNSLTYAIVYTGAPP